MLPSVIMNTHPLASEHALLVGTHLSLAVGTKGLTHSFLGLQDQIDFDLTMHAIMR
jgi:hypothetical protein